MKSLLLIPVMCLLCFGCTSNGNNSTGMKKEESSADWEITTKVKALILADTSISASARLVSVSTRNGVVTLSGNVPTQSDKDRINKIAQNISGVKSVNNQIAVSNS